MTIAAETIATAHGKSIADVALALGADKLVATPERGVPCPGCGGTDRFSVDPAKNVFYCRASGASGDPIVLVQHVHGVGFGKAVEMLAGRQALPAGAARREDKDKSEQFRLAERRRAWRIWQDAYSIVPAKGGRLVAAYFERRGIPFPDWPIPALREADHVDYWTWSKDKQDFVKIHSGPAMLAAITGPDGRFIGLHRTWIDLSRPNGKAVIADPETGEILDAKKVRGTQRGGKIVLRKGCLASRDVPHPADAVAPAGRATTPDARSGLPPAAVVVIGEGIETVLSWDALRKLGTAELWCGINLDNIAGKAAGQIPHPSAVFRDCLGRQRRRKVGGPDPDPKDRDCLMVPGHFERRILLGDGDGDRFATQAAMIRARRRMIATSGPTEIDWAPDGSDFNDELRSAAGRELDRASGVVARPAGATAPAGCGASREAEQRVSA